MESTLKADSGDKALSPAELLARLDALPITPTVWRVIILLMFAWVAEAFDIGIIGPALLIVRHQWHLTPHQVGLFGSVGTFGVVVGLVPAGWLADRIGRKTVLTVGIAIFSVFTMASALADGFGAVIAFRFLAGLGEGAVFPIPYLVASEFVNKFRRGEAVGWTNLLGGMSYMLTSASGLWAMQFSANVGWRVLFALGGIPLLLVPILWKLLPESPRFLLKSGRIDSAREIVAQLESEAKQLLAGTVVKARVLAHENTTIFPPEKRVMNRHEYFRRAFVSYCALGSPFVAFYLIIVFGPELIHELGFSKADALVFAGAINVLASINTPISGYLSDRMGRRGLVIGWMSISAAALVLLWVKGLPVIILAMLAAIIRIFVGGVFPIAKLYMAEQFPTRTRAIGATCGEFVSRLGIGVILMFFIPTLTAELGTRAVLALCGVITFALILPFIFLGTNTANVSIDETSGERSDVDVTEDGDLAAGGLMDVRFPSRTQPS